MQGGASAPIPSTRLDEIEREKMNKNNVLKLAGVVEKSTTYDQTIYAHTCGTPACIAGHAALLAAPHGKFVVTETRSWPRFKFPSGGDIWYVSDVAQVWLNLNDWWADQLFQPIPLGKAKKVTPAQAGKVLRHLAETGEVDWGVAL